MPDQMADHAVSGIVQLDLVEIDLITGEVDDPGRDGGEIFKADARQIAGEKSGTARDMRERKFGATGTVAIGFAMSEIARVME